VLCSSTFFYVPTFGQIKVSQLVRSGPEDATKLADAYLTPLFKGFGVGLNSGWNYTANAKNTGRFDIRLSLTGALIPASAKTFDVNKLRLSNAIRLAQGENPKAPTVAGGKGTGPEMDIFDDQGRKLESFNLPAGVNLPSIPTGTLQATVGLPRGIDVTLRGIPQVKLGSDIGSVNSLGGGVKLEVLRLITGKTVSKILPFDLAVSLGYNEFNYKLPLDVQPSSNASPKDNNQSTDFSGQQVQAKVSAVNSEIILSKKLLFFTPFASVGYNSAKTNVALKGNYPIVTGATLLATPTYTTFTDPVKINRNNLSGFRSNVGFQLNLAAFRFFAAYSIADYNAVTAGIGLGIGK
jgi:hypothetical protein